MIHVLPGCDIANAYIVESYRRLYEASVDSNGFAGDFESIVDASDVKNRQVQIQYDHYFCPQATYDRIMNAIVEERYIRGNDKTSHKLPEHTATSVRCSVALGCSPSSSKKHSIVERGMDEETASLYAD